MKELFDNAVTILPKSHPYYKAQKLAKQDFMTLWRSREHVTSENLVHESFRLIDKYFFFGNLVPHVRLVVQQLYAPPDFYSPPDKGIFIYTLDGPNRSRSPGELVAAVVHEAVHSYLTLFAAPHSFRAENLHLDPHALPWDTLCLTLLNTVKRWMPGSNGLASVRGWSDDEMQNEALVILGPPRPRIGIGECGDYERVRGSSAWR